MECDYLEGSGQKGHIRLNLTSVATPNFWLDDEKEEEKKRKEGRKEANKERKKYTIEYTKYKPVLAFTHIVCFFDCSFQELSS